MTAMRVPRKIYIESPAHTPTSSMSMCFGLLGLLGLKEPWHQAVDAAVLVVVLLLALAGLYYLVTHYARGYDWRVQGLPYETMACPVNAEGKRQKHYLVYVNQEELDEVKKMARHQGKPCHCIDSYPKRKLDEMEPKEGYDAALFSYEGRLNTRNQLREKEERMRKRIREKEAALRKSHDVGLEEDLREERLAAERVNRYRYPHLFTSAPEGPRRLNFA